MKIHLFIISAAAMFIVGDVSAKDAKAVKPQAAVRTVKPIRNLSPGKRMNLELALKKVHRNKPKPGGGTMNIGAGAGLLSSDKNIKKHKPNDGRSRLRKFMEQKVKTGS
jgi:hypothetical protein